MPPASPYQQLKKLDEMLDRDEKTLIEARWLYQETLKEVCHFVSSTVAGRKGPGQPPRQGLP
jgi:hypothetical protein